MTDRVDEALRIAIVSHEGQKDLQGRPFILHVLRVMANVDRRDGSEEALVLAALHDVKEDGELCPDDRQIRDGFGKEVLDALNAITRGKKEGYLDYIERVSKNELATEVKLADLRDHLDPLRALRLKRTHPEKAERLHERYRRAKIILENAEMER